jgi:Skp family chaperone for outer membrane proteins
MMTRKTCYLFLLPALCLAISTSVVADRLYKWVDADGIVQYTSRLPPEASQQERKEINEHGRVLKVYSAPLSEEQRAEAKRLAELEAKKQERAEKRAIHDRSLLSTYSNKEDMRAAQQGKISMVESLLQLTHSRIKSMQDRLVILTEEAASYERSGKELPAPLQQQIQNLRNQIAHNIQFEKDKEAEIAVIKQQFEDDIARYEELTTGRTEAKKPPSSAPEVATRQTEAKKPPSSAPEVATRQAEAKKPPSSTPEVATSNPAVELDPIDRTLLSAFSSEEDLLFARKEELGALDNEIGKAFEMVDKLQKRLDELAGKTGEYETRGESPPHALVTRMRSLTTNIRQGEALLREKHKQKDIVEQRYDKDLERYRQLATSNN